VLNIFPRVITTTYHLIVRVGDYKREYPSAKLIAPKEAIENSKQGDKEIKFDGGNQLAALCISFLVLNCGYSVGC
jgi:hypothetical protein